MIFGADMLPERTISATNSPFRSRNSVGTRRGRLVMHAVTDGLPDGVARDDDVAATHEEDVPKVDVVGKYVDADKVLVAAQRHRRHDEAQRILANPGVPDDHHLLEGS